ncbi:MAG: ABC transporter ATP-binding protein, partial [Moorea sp. SIO4E2]|nr:ABC transporter ATP-binding protein [Moorena sp. SIO4E2]
IARALIRNPRVLVLDEATSSLDTASEALIQDALEHLMENRTTFVVAHRLSTIRKADRIVVMERGHIVEVGNHPQLLAKDGTYTQLHSLQI